MSLPSTWPFPDDSPLMRARRIALAYREHLHLANPEMCAALDETMRAYGQSWVSPTVELYDETDLLTAAQVAELLSVSVGMVRQYRIRNRLHGVSTVDGWRYRLADVRSLKPGRSGRPRRKLADSTT